MEIEQVGQTLYVFFLASARMIAAFMMMPFLSKQSLGSAMIRNGAVASFSLITYPLVEYGFGQTSYSGWETLLIIAKEVFIGLAIGYVINIPFWAVESVGFFIDNQRGATMASAFNPMSGSQTSPLGILLTQALVTIFFISGAFLLMLYSLYQSYRIWPVFEFFPTLGGSGAEFFLAQLDSLMRLTVLLGAPVVIAMFLAEFGLALISRFAPQLNVFILAMPIKSAIAIALLCVYGVLVIEYFGGMLGDMESLIEPVIKVLS
jgi:type III secretion protein T